jgi:hypothetical protein
VLHLLGLLHLELPWWNSTEATPTSIREQARRDLAEWNEKAWSRAIFKEVNRKSHFNKFFNSRPGKYDGVIIRQK